MLQNDPANHLNQNSKEKTSFSQPNQLDLGPKNDTKSTFWPLKPKVSIKIQSTINSFTTKLGNNHFFGKIFSLSDLFKVSRTSFRFQ